MKTKKWKDGLLCLDKEGKIITMPTEAERKKPPKKKAKPPPPEPTCEECGCSPCECCPDCERPPGCCTCNDCPDCGCDPCTCNECENCGEDPCVCGPSEKTASILWGLDQELNLTREAADFYVLVALTVDYPNDARPKYALVEKVGYLADQFARYIDMAIGGELRHAPSELDECDFEGYKIPKTAHRGAAWAKWKDIREEKGIQALKGAWNIFSAPGWGDSYGGESWARVANALIQYESGEWSPQMFVDQVFSIRHNGGPVFDKIWNLGYLEFILNDAQHARILNIVQRASDGVKNLHYALLKEDITGVQEG
uniref:Uncharacterized protein n=1 Tax=viral metagenome TaxID=1070528 RepID=A0A6H1ZGA9_9ZZZZ